MGDVTSMLREMERGNPDAAEQFVSLVYQELRQLAASKLARESAPHTLQPTALVHEAWLRLGGDQQPNWQNRAHFFGAAAEAMRRILIGRARWRQAARHGANAEHLAAEDLDIPAPAADDQLLAINEALERFAAVEPKKAELVKLKYFVGMTLEEAAETFGVSAPTAKRWWAYAKVWLLNELRTS